MTEPQLKRLNDLLEEFAAAQFLDDWGDYEIDPAPIKDRIIAFIRTLNEESQI